MRIAIDLSAVKTQGTIVYLTGLLPALAREDQGNEYLLFMSPHALHAVRFDLPSNFVILPVPAASSSLSRVLWQQLILPVAIHRWKASVLYAPFDIAPLICPCALLVAVRGPAPHTMHQYRYPLTTRTRLLILRALVRMSCRRATRVLFPTVATSELVGRLLEIPADKRRAVYHGTDHGRWAERVNPAPVLQKYGLTSDPFILYVSALGRQKHPDTLIEAFAMWLKQNGLCEHRLVFAFQNVDYQFFSEIKDKVDELGIKERTHFVGLVPHVDLPSFYQASSLVVLPSSMETFGQPAVEAMASGIPVICADTPVAREICGDAALYFPREDSRSLAEAMSRILYDAGLRDDMIKRGLAQSSQFSWDREARETLALIVEANAHWRLAPTTH